VIFLAHLVQIISGNIVLNLAILFTYLLSIPLMKFSYHSYFNRFVVHCNEDDDSALDVDFVFSSMLQGLVGDCPGSRY